MTLGVRSRDRLLLNDLRSLPGLIGWYDFARSPLGTGVPIPAEGTAVDRAWDAAGKLAATVQSNTAMRPVVIPPDAGGRVVNYCRNGSCHALVTAANTLVSSGNTGSSVAQDTTVGGQFGRSMKCTQAATTVTGSWGRRWTLASPLPAVDKVVYAQWKVRADPANTASVNYITWSDGVTGVGTGQGVNSTGATAGAQTFLTPGQTYTIERWWNVKAGDSVGGFGAIISNVADGTATPSLNMWEGIIAVVPAVGARPTIPIVHSDPVTWPGRYAWQGTAYQSPVVTRPSVGGLYFDGVDDRFMFTPPQVPELTVYTAFTGLDSGLAYYATPWTYGVLGQPGAIGLNRGNNTTTVNTRIDARAGGNDTQMQYATSWDGTPHLLTLRASLSQLVKSGVKDGGTVPGNSGNPISTSGGSGAIATVWGGGGSASLGFANGSTQPFAGVLHGFAMFDRMHDVPTRRQVEALFARRYGTPLSASVPT